MAILKLIENPENKAAVRSLHLFVVSLMFMKGTSYCVLGGMLSRVEPLDRAMANY